MDEISNAQRALWTFLMCALVAPFIAGLMALLAAVAAPGWLGAMGVNTRVPAPAGALAINAFVWSAIPAGLAGLAIAVLVYRNGRVDLFAAAAAGVLAFGIAFVLAPFAHGGLLALFAFLAGLIAVAMRGVLMRAGIILP